MLRKSDLLWLSVAVFAGVTLFHTSYRVQELKENLAGFDRQIASEQDGIQVLKAEWSFLNDPARLEQLAATYLTLKPITASQVTGFDALPQRPTIVPASLPPSPPTVNLSAPKKFAQVTPASATEGREGHQAPTAVATLASAELPAQPHRAAKPRHGVEGASLAVSHVSARATTAYAPATDEIGMLLTRLGRIQ